MPWTQQVLVVATLTATSPELTEALQQRAASGPARFTLLMPAAPREHEAAAEGLVAALAQLRGAGLEVEGRLGDPDPMVALTDAWSPREFDEIVISTLPTDVSHWLRADLPLRAAKLTGAPVSHVVASPPRSHPVGAPLAKPPRNRLGPLEVLTWGSGSGSARRAS